MNRDTKIYYKLNYTSHVAHAIIHMSIFEDNNTPIVPDIFQYKA